MSSKRTVRRTAQQPKARLLAGGRLGRPTQDEAKVIHSTVIEAAHHLFLQEGYSAAAMEAIAKRAGVSKKTLYARFPTKAQLFTAVVEAQVAAWSTRAAQYDKAIGKTLSERLEHHAFMFLEVGSQSESRAFERLLLGEVRHFPEVGRIYYKTAVQFALQLIANEIRGAAERDCIPVRDPDHAARVFLESLSGWLTLQVLTGAKTSRSARRRAARYRVAIFMAGRAAW